MAVAQVLTPAQIAKYARDAGVTNPAALALAVAVALAESGGNPRATHLNSDRHRSTDYGLWQINGFWHPQYDKARLLEPAYNAQAMAAISKNGKDWTPWATVDNGRYKQFSAQAAQGVQAGGFDPGGILDGIGGAATNLVEGLGLVDDAAGSAANAAGEAVRGLAGDWARPVLTIALVGVFVGGGLAISAIGLSKLSGFTPNDAAATGMAVAPLAL